MKTVHVAAAIIKKGNKVLIAKRKKGEFAGLWEFPGGKVEEGESFEAALKREILEELELKITISEYLTKATYTYPDFELNMECYICSISQEDICLHDHTEISWIDIVEDNIHLDWIPADIQVFESILDRYKKS